MKRDFRSHPLRVLVFGAGAIGSYIGGSLALHGNQVVFIEQPEIAARLRKSGLHLEIGDQRYHLPEPQVEPSIAEAMKLPGFDIALFSLKSFDTAAALEGMRPFSALLPPILCLQNGVDNEPAIEKALGAGKVIAGTVTSAVGRRGAGDIVLERLRGMGVATGSSISPLLVDALDQAGLNARLFPDAAAMKWSKLVTNLPANATSAILDMTPAEVFAHPGLYALEIAQLREALAVMRAQDIPVVDLPGTPVRLFAFAIRRLPLSISHLVLPRAVGGGRGAKMPSFHIDLHSGRGVSEVTYLNGAVVRAGEKNGVPTPANRLLTSTLEDLVKGNMPLSAFRGRPERLLQLYASAGPGTTP